MPHQLRTCVRVIIQHDMCDTVTPYVCPSSTKLDYFMYASSPRHGDIVVWVEVDYFVLEQLFMFRFQLDVVGRLRIFPVSELARNGPYPLVKQCIFLAK